MSLTVLDTIAEELVTRLETLLVFGTEQTQASEVVRPTRLGDYTPKDLQIVVTQSNTERVPELDCPGNPPATAQRQVFNIRCHVMPSESDTTSVDLLCNQFAADVRKVVCQPQNTWHTFDGNAIDAEWLTQENIESGEGCDGINVPLAIIYRHDEGNPYNVRG